MTHAESSLVAESPPGAPAPGGNRIGRSPAQALARIIAIRLGSVLPILLAISLAFVLSNLESGVIRFLGFQFEMPVWIWFLGVLIVGVLIGSLFPWFRPKSKKK